MKLQFAENMDQVLKIALEGALPEPHEEPAPLAVQPPPQPASDQPSARQ
jgi:hypothetical protein